MTHGEVSRRNFLMGSLGTGVVAGAALFGPSVFLAIGTRELTDYDVGNAGQTEYEEAQCSSAANEDIQNCVKEWKPSMSFIFDAVITAPLYEEMAYRGLASLAVDVLECPERRESPLDVLAHGTTMPTFSAAEIAGGIASTLLFADAHNYTSRGYNMHTIPMAQTLSGAVFWGLARKRGLPASIAAHSTGNFMAVASYLR